ncbi:hypothetical protein LUZ62_010106 [Rhynchospora pubera]|uniref:30S ribosomal protein S14, chloroplastic n=1 Tax=Rhynchospora pubera TaxID=906938 RepID=A0AAV8AZZ9_9POAL|nr:hypothetical protein LUZ62_010106 [Rhynchospora pubera]
MAKKKFNSEGTKAKEIGRKISIDSSILKKEKKSAPIRLHRRCLFTGRPKANYRDFGLSGHILREMIHACLLPGATKSSW